MAKQVRRGNAAQATEQNDASQKFLLLSFHLEQALGIADELNLVLAGARICDAIFALPDGHFAAPIPENEA